VANSEIGLAFLQSAYGNPVAVSGSTTAGLTLSFPASPIGTLPLLVLGANSLADVDGNPVNVVPSMLSQVGSGVQAQTDSTNTKTALVNEANQKFINEFLVAQANAEQLGNTVVYLTTFAHCDVSYLLNYFQNLGYYVTFPDLAPINGAQPAELFGPAWISYWENQVPNAVLRKPENPLRIGIAWSPPNFQFLPLYNEEV
jgi:hypothetical protein